MIYITGIKLIREFMASPNQRVSSVFVDQEIRFHPRLSEILRLARESGIPVQKVEKIKLREMLRSEEVKNGVVAKIGDYRYFQLHECLETDSDEDFAVVIDRVFDPHNLGAIARSAHCFGASFVVIQRRRSVHVTRAAINSSAGALAKIRVALETNVARAIDELKEAGYWIYGADPDAGTAVEEMSFEGKVAVVLGSEGEGLRENVRKRCDYLVRIPMASDFDSLNVSVAAGILFYNVYRRKHLDRTQR